jgi:hypothetical protein
MLDWGIGKYEQTARELERVAAPDWQVSAG